MFTRGLILTGLLGGLTIGCDYNGSLPSDEATVSSVGQAVSVNAQAALDWANGWISEVTADASKLGENVYTATDPALERAIGLVKAKNRSVCGTLTTQLFQKSLGLLPNDFYKSFNKAMDNCDVGTIDKVQKGTSSPNAAQYHYKIVNCATTGPIKFSARSTITSIERGDVLSVKMPERTDISGHVMVVRAAPVVDSGLPAGPTGSTPYAVEIIDSTSTPHGTSTTYPDWRGGSTGQGLGHGTFVLYADAAGAIVASRWSPTDGTLFDTTAHPVAVGGLQ